MGNLPSARRLLEAFAFPVGVPRQFRDGLTVLWIAMGLAVLAHARWMPAWAIALNLAALGTHALTMMKWPRQRQKIDNLVAITLMVLMTQLHHNFPDRETGIAIFPILFIFKLRQLYKPRDYHVLCMMACVQAGLLFLYQQSFLMLLYVGCVCMLLVYAMALPYLPRDIWTARQRISYAAKLCGQSLPFLLLLFVLFPRIPGPLWSLPSDSDSGKTGISDKLEIGNISNLVQSDRPVFRATFAGEPPERNQLYWRGPVLWFANDSVWSKGAGVARRRVEISDTSNQVSYSMTMELQQDEWLFALGLVDPVPQGTRLSEDLQLLRKKGHQHQRLYQLQSYLRYQVREVEPKALRYATQLPTGRHPRARALARQWLDEGLSPQQIVDKALGMFNDDFSYTLRPPLMQQDAVDQFLFTHRAGFCSHFATSFATLMRAAGIPARVVTGFQGGEFNDIGSFFLVRELDAHAWAEVWLPDRGGWVQVDPTAAVAPERIETGMSGFLSSTAGRRAGAPVSISDALPFSFHKRLAEWVDAARHRWNQNILQYNRDKQRELLQKTGIPNIAEHPWLALATVLLLLLATTATMYFKRPKNTDPIKSAYDDFCMKLEKLGLPWHKSQPPLRRQELAERNWPNKAKEIDKITKTYLQLRYGTGGDPMQFLLLVKNFRMD